MTPLIYKCICGSKNRVLISRFNDTVETTQLEKAFEQLIDSAWDDEDDEADELLASAIRTMKKDSSYMAGEHIVNIMEQSKDQTNTILQDLSQQVESCNCKEVSNKVSIVVNWGLSELKQQFNREPDENRLLEVLNQLEPFAEAFKGERNFESFLHSVWNYSFESGKTGLLSKLVLLFPSEVDRLVDKILAAELEDPDQLPDSADFNRLATIVCVADVFRHVSLYLAEKDTIMPSQTQVVLAAILKTVRSNLPKRKWLGLYSARLSPIVAIITEIINPEDPLVLSLLQKVREECNLDYVILVSHFPQFAYLK